MLDKIGNELAIGDYVAFVQGSCGYKQSPNLVIARIESYDGKRLMQVVTNGENPCTYNKMPSSCIKVYHK